MIKDYESLLKQLDGLSKVINSFKSEAVQLKLIEIIFKTRKESEEIEEDVEDSIENSGKKTKSRKKKKTVVLKDGPTKKTTSPKGRPGPVKTLEQLVKDNYFASKRTIGEIVQHCNDHLAVTMKSTTLSGILMKMVRDKTLKRSKNPETKQYEYIINKPSTN